MTLPTGPAALRLASWLALLVPAALLGGAYLSQYGFGLFPCEMCWWQRYPHFAALALALVGLAARNRPVIGLAALAILASGLVGLFHAGVEYKWWHGITPCAAAVKLGPGVDPLDAIMNHTPLVSCDQPQWTLFGVSLAGFNFLISTAGALLVMLLLVRSSKEAAHVRAL
jgi:disulfide bond formation protein DsbB